MTKVRTRHTGGLERGRTIVARTLPSAAPGLRLCVTIPALICIKTPTLIRGSGWNTMPPLFFMIAKALSERRSRKSQRNSF
jgi:hypothetical protein